MNISKKEIDDMSYFDLLKKWRFAPSGDPIHRNSYFLDALTEKRIQVKNPNEVSDLVRWEK